ncbi:rod shape-determining protein MreD [Chroococcidiopsis sp. FACHB-1243]|uniref:rod shape-determining protein MreD n=1 Tax=Chroococcidiopsis sp. [FACHB-1243] TaxID=2692781 RepID=UPI00177E2546|nr:rod shape-determining protein MreD [Chroococcidiopsis sp. [FACHB-1243]]MBD2307661.1 rod shape-determining protein MreD [Chroococcidiopsis sp. [FACHB-1243]]
MQGLKSLRHRWQKSPGWRQLINGVAIVGSASLCLLLLPMRLPGTVLLGIAPNWLLIWVVTWSIKRSVLQGAIAGITLGLIQDGMTAHNPTHVFGLMMVGILTARLQKQRYLQEDFISVALIVFAMTIMVETIATLQFGFLGEATTYTFGLPLEKLAEVWQHHQQIALISAVISSLWAPVIYYPLNHWWTTTRFLGTR